jgi:hypothetical protein
MGKNSDSKRVTIASSPIIALVGESDFQCQTCESWEKATFENQLDREVSTLYEIIDISTRR